MRRDVGLLFVVFLAGCAAERAESSASAVSEMNGVPADDPPALVPTFLDEQLLTVSRIVEERARGKTYIASAQHLASGLEPPLGEPLAATARRAALADCAVYGGGLSATAAPSEDPNKYLDRATREELAALLDEAIGPAKIFRLASFPVGDASEPFKAKCTIAVERTPESFTMLQGHGRDQLPVAPEEDREE